MSYQPRFTITLPLRTNRGGPAFLAFGYWICVAAFQVWRWILGRVARTSLGLALSYRIPARQPFFWTGTCVLHVLSRAES
jgi:hypothetical protein